MGMDVMLEAMSGLKARRSLPHASSVKAPNYPSFPEPVLF